MLLFWSCLFGVLNGSYIWMSLPFSRLGKLSAIFLVFFHRLWSNSSTLSSIPDILFSTCSTLLAKVLIEVFIWDIKLFVSKMSISLFSGFLYLYWIPLSYSAFSSLFQSSIYMNSFSVQLFFCVCVLFELIQLLIHLIFEFIDNFCHCF
jgi:hypothetical protein